MPQSTPRLFSAAALFALLCAAASGQAHAGIVVTGAFGPNGDVGFANSPPTLGISFGSTGQGQVFQMDGFFSAIGVDFNGPANFGTAQQLTDGAPAGVGYTFSSTQPTPNQLVLTYHFVNNTGAALNGVQFSFFVDADIAPNPLDEWVTSTGALGSGPPDSRPSSFQVGDPTVSTIFSNLLNGALNSNNEMGAPERAGDVSIALGFSAGTVAAGSAVDFIIMLSDNSTSFSGLALTQRDTVSTTNTLTVSGTFVPEPSSFLSLGAGLGVAAFWARGRRRRASARPA